MKPVHTFGDYRRFRYISAIVALLAGFGYTLCFCKKFSFNGDLDCLDFVQGH